MGLFIPEFTRGKIAIGGGAGWKAETPNPFDPRFIPQLVNIPTETDLRAIYPSCFQATPEDQLQTSSCVGNSTVTGLEYAYARAKGKLLNFSRMGVYALARKKRGWLSQDHGCFIKDAAASINETGICLESFHPFTLANLFKDLDAEAYAQCSRHRIQNIERVERGDVRNVLAERHQIIVVGITVFQECVFSEEAQRTGIIRLPKSSDTFGGGHALLVAKYNDLTGRYGGPNSWGPNWGNAGWYEFSMDYINNPELSDDFWTFTVTA